MLMDPLPSDKTFSLVLQEETQLNQFPNFDTGSDSRVLAVNSGFGATGSNSSKQY